MKKILLTFIAVIFVTGLFAQTDGTGTGWSPNRKKENYKDSVYFNIAPTYKAGQYETLSDLVPMLNDSTYSYTYGAGLGLASDTAAFQNNAIVGVFHNDRDTLGCTDLWGALKSGTGTETLTIQVSWDVNFLDGTPTVLNTSAFTINDIEGAPGDHDTSFNNPKIPPNVWVWFTIAGLTANNKPTLLAGSLYFYRIPSH